MRKKNRPHNCSKNNNFQRHHHNWRQWYKTRIQERQHTCYRQCTHNLHLADNDMNWSWCCFYHHTPQPGMPNSPKHNFWPDWNQHADSYCCIHFQNHTHCIALPRKCCLNIYRCPHSDRQFRHHSNPNTAKLLCKSQRLSCSLWSHNSSHYTSKHSNHCMN